MTKQSDLMEGKAMLEIKHVYKSYDDKEVLSDITFEIHKGEIHGLIGENSAGKTTLIKCLTGIYRTDKGEILYDGQPVFDQPEVKQNIGYVADYNVFLRGYTVKRMVKLYQAMYPNFSTEKFEKLNKIFGVESRDVIQTLSKGTTTKLAFMLALSSGATYLILDEPTSGLDVGSRRNLLEILVSEVEQRNLAVLISSHNLEGLEKICDKATLLKNGEVLATEDMEQMRRTYVKVQVVFENGAPKEFYEKKDILEKSNVGSIYTVVSSQPFDSLSSELKAMGAGLVEQISISLEDTFLLANKKGILSRKNDSDAIEP